MNSLRPHQSVFRLKPEDEIIDAPSPLSGVSYPVNRGDEVEIPADFQEDRRRLLEWFGTLSEMDKLKLLASVEETVEKLKRA